ncbi:MAG: WhiB family transcriptional regulator [Micrococcales bacterium]|nr:WhiB family transcriptional regulator [Micrococcales bacterium]
MSKHNPQLLNLRPVYDEWAWQEQSNCREADSDLFFLDPLMRGKEKRDRERAAKKVCKGCPVVQQCLNHALSIPEFFGVWGGMTADERNSILRKKGLRIIK